jgi:hypothetical protein
MIVVPWLKKRRGEEGEVARGRESCMFIRHGVEPRVGRRDGDEESNEPKTGAQLVKDFM